MSTTHIRKVIAKLCFFTLRSKITNNNRSEISRDTGDPFFSSSLPGSGSHHCSPSVTPLHVTSAESGYQKMRPECYALMKHFELNSGYITTFFLFQLGLKVSSLGNKLPLLFGQ